MNQIPELQNDFADHEASGRAEAVWARPGDSTQAFQMGDEIIDWESQSAPPSTAPFAFPADPRRRAASEPLANGLPETVREGLPEAIPEGGPGAFAEGPPETVREGVPGASAEGLARPLGAPLFVAGFEAAPDLVLPLVDLSALPSKSPSQIALAHRPWEHSTGPRSLEGKKRAALNGKNRQIGVLSVRELRDYKKGQKNLLETLDRTLMLTREVIRSLEEVQEQRS